MDDDLPAKVREAKARICAARDHHFESWMRTPAIQLLISLIPPANPPELVQTMLREAFEAGSSSTMEVLVREVGRWGREQGRKP